MQRHSQDSRGGRRAMTLIEMIIVLAMLSIVLALSMPLLSQFARGRSLEEEGRRMLALTRYARNEAVSRGLPMELWIDADVGMYGLRTATGFEDGSEEKDPIEYTLRESIAFTVETTGTVVGAETTIRFEPDGAIVEPSPSRILIEDTDQYQGVLLERTVNGLAYEIRQLDQEELENARTATGQSSR